MCVSVCVCVCVCVGVCVRVCVWCVRARVCKARIATTNISYSQAVPVVAACTVSWSRSHVLRITMSCRCSSYSSSVRSCRIDILHQKTHTHPSNTLQVAGLARRIEFTLWYQIMVPTLFTRLRRLDRDNSAILLLQGNTEERGHVVVSWKHSNLCGLRPGAHPVLKFVR